MPKIDLNSLPIRIGSGYPGALADGFEKRLQKRVGEAGNLTQFGVNLVTLEPGGMSALRHWHEQQDEFLVVTDGKLVLIDDDGETQLVPGDCCAFAAGDANGHHLVNRSGADASFVVVGTRTPTETAWYSDVDMKVTIGPGAAGYTKKDGSPI